MRIMVICVTFCCFSNLTYLNDVLDVLGQINKLKMHLVFFVVFFRFLKSMMVRRRKM